MAKAKLGRLALATPVAAVVVGGGVMLGIARCDFENTARQGEVRTESVRQGEAVPSARDPENAANPQDAVSPGNRAR